MLRWFKRTLITLAGFILIVALLAATFLLLVSTDFGRARIASLAGVAASSALDGTVSLGSIDGALFSDFTLRDVVVRDADDDDVIRIDRIRLAYKFDALLGGTVHVTNAEIDRAWVRLETLGDGRTNLEALIPPSNTPPSTGPPPPLTIQVDQLTLRDGALLNGPINRAEKIVDSVELDASARVPIPDVDVTVESLSAHIVEPDLETCLKSRARFVDGTAMVDGLQLWIDEHEVLHSPRFSFDTTTTAANTTVEIDVPVSLLQKITKDPALTVALVATATASHPGPNKPWRVTIGGRLNDAPISIDATVAADFSEIDARARIAEIDPHDLHGAAPSGRVDLNAHAIGPLDDFTASATMTADRVSGTWLEIPHAEVRAALQGLPTAPRGLVRLRANGVVVSNQAIGHAELDVTIADSATHFEVGGKITGGRPLEVPAIRAAVDIDGTAVTAHVHEIAVRTRETLWRGKKMTVAVQPSGAIRIDDLVLVSSTGRLAASGLIEPSDLIRKSEDVRVELRDVHLDTLSNIAPGVPKLGGVLNLDAKLDRGRIDTTIAGRAIVVYDMSPLTIDGTVILRGRTLTSSITANGAVLGRAAVQIRGQTPEDPLDVDAWVRRSMLALEQLDLTLSALDIAELGVVTGQSYLREGRIDGHVRAGPRARKVDAAVKIRDLRIDQLDLPIDADVEAHADAKRTEANLELSLDRKRIVTLKASADVAIPVIERRGVRALRDANVDLDLEIERLEIGPIVDAIDSATTTPAIGGVISGALTMTKRGADVTANADVHADDVRPHRQAPILDGRLTLDLVPGRADARVWIEGPQDMGAAAHARVETPKNALDFDAWQKLPLDNIQTVTASTTNVRLMTIASLTGVRLPPGRMSMSLKTGPGLSSPFVFVDLRRVDVSRALGEFGSVVTLREQDDRTVVALALFANDRPFLSGDVRVKPTVRQIIDAGPEKILELPMVGSFRSPVFDIRTFFRAKSFTSRFSGDLRTKIDVAGRIEQPELTVHLGVENAQLGGRLYDRFEIDGRYQKNAIEAATRFAQNDGGKLDVDLKLDERLDGALTADKFQLDAIFELIQVIFGTPFGTEDGFISASIRAQGTPDAPEIAGQIELDAGRAEVGYNTPPIGDAKVRVEFEGGDVIAKVDGDVGGGPMKMEASGTVLPPEKLAFQAKLSTKKSRVAAGPMAALVTIEVEAKGQRRGDELTIDVVTKNGSVRLPGDPGGTSLHPVGDMEDVVFIDAAGVASRADKAADADETAPLITIVNVRTDGAIVIEGEDIQTAVEANVSARTTPAGMAMNGSVSLPRGKVKVIAHEYVVERANVYLDGQVPLDPRLDILLTKEFSDQGVLFNVIITGTAKNPVLTFTADPPVYSRGELMQVFLGGEPGVDSGGEFNERQALNAAAGLILGPIAKAARRSLPIDTIDIDLGDDDEQSGKVGALTLGKWLTSDLFVAYTYTLTEEGTSSGGSAGLLRYRFTGSWVLEVQYAQSQDGSASVLWVKRF